VGLLSDPSPANERSIQTPPWQHRPSPQEQAGEHARQELLIVSADR
jgi:hypothetical protein